MSPPISPLAPSTNQLVSSPFLKKKKKTTMACLRTFGRMLSPQPHLGPLPPSDLRYTSPAPSSGTPSAAHTTVLACTLLTSYGSVSLLSASSTVVPAPLVGLPEILRPLRWNCRTGCDQGSPAHPCHVDLTFPTPTPCL
jgi:hypothetical protein